MSDCATATNASLLAELHGRVSDFGALESIEFAKGMDEVDPLAAYRSEFYFPGATPAAKAADDGSSAKQHECSLGGKAESSFRYFCGNSLGLQHKDVADALLSEVHKWRSQAVEGHFLLPNPWFEIDDVLRSDMATIVGAQPSEVVIMNSLTANLHLLLSAFYRPEGRRRKLMSENFPFPSDTHAFVSQVASHGLDPDECYITVPGSAQAAPGVIDTQCFLDAIEEHGDSVAVIVIGAVHFLTGQYFDIEAVTRAAHAKGILVGVDAAHGAGNVPLQLHDWGVDFACWCTYKYLNAGPGNIAGLFVHERHTPPTSSQSSDITAPSPLRGWWGHQRTNRFALHRTFESSVGAAAFQLSNPCVMAMMSLAPSLKLAARVGMPALRKKSLLLTRYMEYLIDAVLAHAVEIITPRDPQRRGCQLSIRIKPGALSARDASSEAYACGNNLKNDADLAQRLLLDRGVMCDNRPPDILRLAPVPIYNSFEDVWRLINVLSTLF